MGVTSDNQARVDPIPAGGATSGLDLSNVRDQGLARQAMKNWPKRWKGLTEEFKDRCAKQLQIAIDEADSLAMAGPEGIAEAAKIRLSAVKTAAMMEAQNQSDEHLLHKTDTDGSEKHKVEVVYVNKPKQSHEDRPVATAGLLPVAVGGTAPVPERGGGGELAGASGGD